MFVIETRKDLKDFEEAMEHVEAASLDEVPDERIPKWFEGEDEITDEDLEDQFWNDFATESEIGDIEQYDSILGKLRQNIKNRTQSFYEPNDALNDSLIHNYNWNEASNVDYNNELIAKRKASVMDNLWRSVVIQTGVPDEEAEGDDIEKILDFSF